MHAQSLRSPLTAPPPFPSLNQFKTYDSSKSLPLSTTGPSSGLSYSEGVAAAEDVALEEPEPEGFFETMGRTFNQTFGGLSPKTEDVKEEKPEIV